jgi:hypothetical protein
MQEIMHISVGLQADDVSGAETLQDRPAHRVGEKLPVAGGRPGDMDEVLQDSIRHFLAKIATDEVQLVIVDHYEWRRPVMRRFGYNSVSESAVNCDIAVIPGIVDLGIDIRGVGRVPHVMLEKPE